jgi:hypothetical protein
MLKSPALTKPGFLYFSLLRCRTAARRRRATAIVLHRPIAAGRRAAARVVMVMMHRLARIRRVGARARAGAGIRTGAVRLIGACRRHGWTSRPVVGRTGGRRATHLLIARGLRKARRRDRGRQGKRATEYKSAIRHKSSFREMMRFLTAAWLGNAGASRRFGKNFPQEFQGKIACNPLDTVTVAEYIHTMSGITP